MSRLAGTCLLLCLVMAQISLAGQEPGKDFEKRSFYAAMSGNSQSAINQQLELLKSAHADGRQAYEGALLMKKAGMVLLARQKLGFFKQGHQKLESVLKMDSGNAEYHFLRLMIQEHAPGILGYNKELEKDRQFIKGHFRELPPAVQEAARNYSKTSKILKPDDLSKAE